jgi:hypothetical protein
MLGAVTDLGVALITGGFTIGAVRAGRQADSARRRQRVITAINQAGSHGTEISVRIGRAHRAMAAVRNTVVGILHLHRVPNIAA